METKRKEKMTPDQLIAAMDHFSGTEQYHRLSIVRGVVFTDGMAFLAQEAGAFWLMDVIATQIVNAMKKAPEETFFLCELTKNSERSAVFEIRSDIGEPAIVRQEIEYTDFPLEQFSCFAGLGEVSGMPVMVGMLKSEY